MKSILIIDTPKDCGECPLNSHTEFDFDVCWATQGKGGCPLRPLPTDMIGAYANSFAEDYISFTEGWDSYAKALMGETE